MKRHHSTPKTILAALAVLAVPAAAFAAPAVGSAPDSAAGSAAGSSTAPRTTMTSCPQSWGSLPESNSRMDQSPVTSLRTGRHACYDRLVVELRGRSGGYDVRYVGTVWQEGSGAVVPLRGSARLQVVVHAPSYSPAGTTTYTPANRRELANVNGYSTFRQVAYAGSFEGQTTIGLGVRARLPFRVFTLAGPGSDTRLVVDVAHRW